MATRRIGVQWRTHHRVGRPCRSGRNLRRRCGRVRANCLPNFIMDVRLKLMVQPAEVAPGFTNYCIVTGVKVETSTPVCPVADENIANVLPHREAQFIAFAILELLLPVRSWVRTITVDNGLVRRTFRKTQSFPHLTQAPSSKNHGNSITCPENA